MKDNQFFEPNCVEELEDSINETGLEDDEVCVCHACLNIFVSSPLDPPNKCPLCGTVFDFFDTKEL